MYIGTYPHIKYLGRYLLTGDIRITFCKHFGVEVGIDSCTRNRIAILLYSRASNSPSTKIYLGT